jgi:hypothetical protein
MPSSKVLINAVTGEVGSPNNLGTANESNELVPFIGRSH